MKTTQKILVAAAVALVAAVGASTALAETTKCVGTLAAVTVDNVKVPRGATCTLNGTRVEGSIKVGRDATLIAMNVRVKGNVQAKQHTAVTINGTSKVGGSIQLDDGGAAMVRGARVKGEVQLVENFGVVAISTNRVNGDVQLFENDGAITIASNRIDGNLQCKENFPEPLGGGATNMVEGNAEDQCEALALG